MLQLQDHNAVSDQIAALDQSLSRFEAVESRLSENLYQIRARINGLRNQRAALESRIAVVWSLPYEILAYIFEIGVKDEEKEVATLENGVGNDGLEHLQFNLLVSRVCRAFREVAIHTSTLWSQIHIYDLEPPRLDFVRACVQRSCCSGLNIAIVCDNGLLDSEPDLIHQLMGILHPHIYRFKRLTVKLWGFEAMYHAMQHLDEPAPQLKRLELVDVDYENAYNEDDPFDLPGSYEPLTLFGGIMPKLESVALDGAHVAWAKCNLKGLKELLLGYHTRDVRPTYEEFKTIIDASPALHTLDLQGPVPLISGDTAESSLYPPLQMERLEDLRLSRVTSDHATTLISLLNIPNVGSLSLKRLDSNDNDYSAFFRRIIGPPVLFPALTALKLASVDVDDDAIEDLLRVSSKLTHLKLYFKGMSTSWLALLEPKGSDYEVLCPKLECLRCVNVSSFELKNLLEKRQDAGFPIPTLQVDKETGNFEGKRFMEWIKENVALEIIEPSEYGTNDEMDDTGSDWDDEIGGIPFSMEGFSDEDEDEDEDYEDDENPSDMEVDETSDSEE